MKLSILSIIGIILILLEVWLPKWAKKLEDFLTNSHKKSSVLFRKAMDYYDKKNILFSILWFVSMLIMILGMILDQYYPEKKFYLIAVFMVIFMLLLSLPIFVITWLNFLAHLFHYFSYSTKGKPFMSIGILIVIFDTYSKEIISFLS